MDQSGSASHEHAEATPIFGAGRRGYDPDQVDRYVADQQRRLDEALHRASEAERKLAAAVGQLRELHRRVAVLESEDRSPQPQSLDTLGERVQRILQEAWEGAYALRQSAEQEVNEIREEASIQAEEVVSKASRRAQTIEAEIERRRRSYLDRVEQDRAEAVAQITYLHGQRDAALGDLMKVKDVIEATVGNVSDLEPALAASPTADSAEDSAVDPPMLGLVQAENIDPEEDADDIEELDDGHGHGLPPTMAVHHLRSSDRGEIAPDPSELVRSHRAQMEQPESAPPEAPGVFDFEAE